MDLDIITFDKSLEERWDRFVLEESVNGTFLQTRRFLNYHPSDRFADFSLLIMQGSEIVAVVPACITVDEGRKCFFSHMGSTYGGIVIAKRKYSVSVLDELVPLLDRFLAESGFERAVLKQTSDIFCGRHMDLLDYFLFKQGFCQFDELSFYVDVSAHSSDELLSMMSGSRRRDYRYALKNELELVKLESADDIEKFYVILCKNLEKFGKKPVHTLPELLEFNEHRLKDTVGFFGVKYQGQIVAGAMTFSFGRQTLHTQYLAQDPAYADYFVMNFLDFELIKLAKEKEYQYFSFGISTEERGKFLNKGLALFKEGFGCDYCINRSYQKDYMKG